MGLYNRNVFKALSERRWAGYSALALYFSFWILISPASWKTGLLPGYAPEPPPFFAVPSDTLTKFGPHPLARFLHILCGALWTLPIPFQLSASLRRSRPALHRWAGRACFMAGCLVMAGYVLIELRTDVMKEHPGMHAVLYRTEAMWFSYTLLRAALAARSKRYPHHAVWAVRHVAAGSWLAAWRVLLIPVSLAFLAAGKDMSRPETKLAGFHLAGWLSAAASAISGEWAVAAAQAAGAAGKKGS